MRQDLGDGGACPGASPPRGDAIGIIVAAAARAVSFFSKIAAAAARAVSFVAPRTLVMVMVLVLVVLLLLLLLLLFSGCFCCCLCVWFVVGCFIFCLSLICHPLIPNAETRSSR